jgi:hypothetical protein
VLDVNAQDLFEVATAEDQQVVETLLSDGADEALGVGVRLRRADRCVDDADAFAAEYVVEGSGELPVAVVDQRASSRCQRGASPASQSVRAGAGAEAVEQAQR